jgi:hypothetical protein
MKVIYAHTDSIYVPVPSIERAKEIQQILNQHVQETIFPNVMNLEEHPIDLEFEKFYSVLGVGATKNKNAGYITWKDGVHLSEPEFFATGFTLKRIAESNIGKEIQKEAVEMWINQKTEKEIIDYAKEWFNKILNGKVEKSDLAKRSRIKSDRLTVQCSCKKKYNIEQLRRVLNIIPDAICEKESCNSQLRYCKTVEDKRPSFSGGFAGLLYYNEHINPTDKITDSFYHMKCQSNKTYTDWNGQEKKVNYVAVRNLSELESFEPDWIFLAQSEIIKKVSPIFAAMNWDVTKIIADDKQKELEVWF